LRRRIALSTRFEAAFPYFRPLDFFELLRFRFVVAISSPGLRLPTFSNRAARQEPRTTTRISLSFAVFLRLHTLAKGVLLAWNFCEIGEIGAIGVRSFFLVLFTARGWRIPTRGSKT